MGKATTEFKIQLLETLAALITAAFGLVAALAWNDTIKGLISMAIPSQDGTVWGNLIYAIIVTVVAVIATLLVAKSIGKLKEKAAKEKE